MEERISGWTYAVENGRDYVDLLDNSGEITYSPISGICGGVPSSCEKTANFSYNIGLVDWTMSGDDPCNIVKAVGGIPSCNQEMFVCWFNGGSNLQYNRLLTDYGATLFIRKNVDECNHVMIISGDPEEAAYSGYQFVHGNGTQYFSTTRYTDSGFPRIAINPISNCSPKYISGRSYTGHKIKYLPKTNTISGACIVDNPNLVELYFPDYGNDKDYSGCTIQEISNGAFSGNTNLSAITLNAVKTIGANAFSGCTSLKNIDWGRCCCNNKPSRVETIGSFAFNKCSGLTDLIIPDSVKSISGQAFSYCTSLSSCTIGNRVTSIGGSAFLNCSGLTNLTIGSGVKTIGNSAFNGCSNLTSINIPSSVSGIGYAAFASCTSLSSITLNWLNLDSIQVQSSAFQYLPSDGTFYVPEGKVQDYCIWKNGLLGKSGWKVTDGSDECITP